MQRILSNTILILSLFMLTGCKNFHTVEEGKLYRSAQLSYEEFQQAIDKYKIQTIINLRGAAPDQAWYQDEIDVSRVNNVNHIDIAMSASRLPHRDDLLKLLDVYRTAPRPMLVHCRMGADRTGEASALYKLIYMKSSLKDALKMLRKRYFHFSFIMPAKKCFVGDAWKGEEWAFANYNPCAQDQNYKHYDKAAYCDGQPPSGMWSSAEDQDSSNEEGQPSQGQRL